MYILYIFLIMKAGKCSHVIQTSGENINICWSPDGKQIAVGNKVFFFFFLFFFFFFFFFFVVFFFFFF